MERRKKKTTQINQNKRKFFPFLGKNEKSDTKRLRNRQNEDERMELVEINEDEKAIEIRKQMYGNMN